MKKKGRRKREGGRERERERDRERERERELIVVLACVYDEAVRQQTSFLLEQLLYHISAVHVLRKMNACMRELPLGGSI